MFRSIIFAILLVSCLLNGCSQLKEAVNPAPKAEFSFQIGKTGSVTFVNKSLNATSQKWDFGNGDTSINKDPITDYSSNGQYVVTLTVTGKGGSDVTSKTLIISDIKGNLTVYSGSAKNNKPISIYIDGVFFGSLSGVTYYPSAPGCYASSTVYGPLTEGQHNLYATEQGTSRTWSSKINVVSGKCSVFGLI